MPEYTDKNIDQDENSIKSTVRKEYKKLKEEKGRIKNAIVREDKRYRQAWQRTVDNYIKEIKNADTINRFSEGQRKKFKVVDKEEYVVEKWKAKLHYSWNIYRKHAIKYFQDAYKGFQEKVKKMQNLESLKLYWSNQENWNTVLEKVSKDIDKAEYNALRKIAKYCNPMQSQDNAAYHESYSWKVNEKWELEKKKPMFTHNNGFIKFTSSCNPVAFPVAVKWLFKKEKIEIQGEKKEYYPEYEIDYTNCQKESVKSRMEKETWWLKWNLYKDPNNWIYYIKWINWKIVDATKIWIYEWVTMKRQEILQDEEHERELTRKAKLWNLEAKTNKDISPEDDEELKKYVSDIPDELREELKKLWNEAYRTFIINIENRLASTLREKRRYWYQLQGNLASYRSIWSKFGDAVIYWRMNPFISSDNSDWIKLNFTLWDADNGTKESVIFDYNTLNNKNLINLLQKEKFKEYFKLYLEKRTVEIRDNLEEIAPKEDLLMQAQIKHESLGEKMTEEEVILLYSWIAKLKKFFNAWKWNDKDVVLNAMINDLNNLEHTLDEHWKITSKNILLQNAIEPTISKITSSFPLYNNILPQNILYQKFEDILTKDEITKDTTLRDLSIKVWGTLDTWFYYWTQDWTTSFIADDLSQSDNNWESQLEIDDPQINKYYQRIFKTFNYNINFDNEWNLISDNGPIIDELYNACKDNTWKWIIRVLNKYNIIPNARTGYEKIITQCQHLAKALQKTQKRIDGLEKEIEKSTEKEYSRLILKDNKTPEEEEHLRVLKYYRSHEKEADAYYKIIYDCTLPLIRYQWISDLISGHLTEIFMEIWWWANINWYKWEAWKIYNDIKWHWIRDFSDSTVVTMANTFDALCKACLQWPFIDAATLKIMGAFPKLIKCLNACKGAILTRTSKVATKLLNRINVSTTTIESWIEILKNSPSMAETVLKNTFSKLWNWEDITLDGALCSIGLSYLRWLGWVVWKKIWTGINKCLDPIFAALWQALPDQTIKKICEKVWSDAIEILKQTIISDNNDTFTCSLDSHVNDLNMLRNNSIKSKIEKLKLPFKSIKLSKKIVDRGTKTIKGTRDINGYDIKCLLDKMVSFFKNQPSKVNNLIEKVNRWELEICRWTEPWDIFIHNPNSWSTYPFKQIFTA